MGSGEDAIVAPLQADGANNNDSNANSNNKNSSSSSNNNSNIGPGLMSKASSTGESTMSLARGLALVVYGLGLWGSSFEG